MMDGILNVYKEKGFTSHDVVAKLRGILRQKKIGHTGTLDPDATGVLPVCLGRATKVCELLTDKSKRYTAVVRLGVETDTQDMTGTVQKECPVSTTLDEIRKTVQLFVGEIEQIPPMYSAIKMNGKRLYELARQGVEVERKARKITIYSCEVTEYFPEKNEFTMTVNCSKGTYIRTLCYDIGVKLGCGAAMASLVRDCVEPFERKDALTLEQIEELQKSGGIESVLYSVEYVFDEHPVVVVKDSGIRYIKNGNRISQSFCIVNEVLSDGQLVRIHDKEGKFYAIYKYQHAAHEFVNHKMFFNEGFARG